MTRRLVCLGFGYVAAALGARLMAEGWQVAGSTRDPGRAAELRAHGVDVVPFFPPRDGVLDGAEALLVSAAPDATGDPVLAVWSRALAAAAPRLRWIGYLSSTGVYGDCGGAWIDEARPPAPRTAANAARLRAEQAWTEAGARLGVPVQVFRLPGIYGPGPRSPFRALRAGTARRIDKPGQVFNRMHVTDIAAVLAASIDRPDAGRIYNLSDDLPAPGHAVTAHAAALLGIEPPPLVPFDAAELPPMARQFLAESRRIRNDRIKTELGVSLRFPTYRDGLAAILAAETSDAA